MMRLFSFCQLFLIFSLFPLFSVSAEEGNGLSACENAWIEAFDSTTSRLSDVELPPFLQQNEVAGADLWAGYRTFSLRNECLLRAVCAVATDERSGDDFLALKNEIGGVVPGEFYECPTDATSGTEPDISTITFEQYLSPASVDIQNIRDKCYPEGKRPEQTGLLTRANACALHREYSVQIFDRTLQKMLLRDVNRKRSGFLSQKVVSLLSRIQEVNETLSSFIVNANAYFAKSCTLSHTN